MTELGFFYDWLIVDVVLHDDRVFDPINVQICDPARPTTVVSGGPGRRRWEFMRLDHETLDELECPRRGSCSSRGTSGPTTPPSSGAPCTPSPPATPSGGGAGGCCSPATPPTRCRRSPGRACAPGIRDAANLAWKLDLVLTGRGARRAAGHLRPRAPAQRPPGHRVLHRARQGHLRPRPRRGHRTRRGHGPARRTGTDRRPAASWHRRAASIDAGSPHAGSLFVQGTVGGRRFDDVHGAGWRLVTIDPEPHRARPGRPADGSPPSAAAS